MQYEEGIYAKFNQIIGEANKDKHDPTLIFIATDGGRIYKAFIAPAEAVKGDFETTMGLDDDIFIGIWSNEWLREKITALEDGPDPEQGWSDLMQTMVLEVADSAAGMSHPGTRDP